ncbi:MAG: phage tail protein, partial [Acidobacteriota bacterium]
HTHVMNGSSANATIDTPAATDILGVAGVNLYKAPSSLVAMDASIIGNVGGSQAHLNMQPFLVLNFSIALQGIFPSPN